MIMMFRANWILAGMAAAALGGCASLPGLATPAQDDVVEPAVPVVETAPLRPELAPLTFLTGNCWKGTFPDGVLIDVHCYEVAYDGAFVREVHAVPGETGIYRGETLYHWDPESEMIHYRYYTNTGGVSDGTAGMDGDALRFPDEIHRYADGRVQIFSSQLERIGEDSYRVVSNDVTDGANPVEVYSMVYERITRDEAFALIEGGL